MAEVQWGLMQLVAGTYERFLLGFEAEAGLVSHAWSCQPLWASYADCKRPQHSSLCYRSSSVHSPRQPTRQV